MALTTAQTYNSRLVAASATIASGQTTSAAIEVNGLAVVGIILPAAMTGTSLTLQASVDGTNFYTIADSNNTNVTVTYGASKMIYLNSQITAGVESIKLVSGSSEGADRAFTLIMRPV